MKKMVTVGLNKENSRNIQWNHGNHGKQHGHQKKNSKFFNISTFNVRGLKKEVKQNQLDDDMIRYGIDILCIQETKIKEGIDINLKNSRLITFPTKKSE